MDPNSLPHGFRREDIETPEFWSRFEALVDGGVRTFTVDRPPYLPAVAIHDRANNVTCRVRFSAYWLASHVKNITQALVNMAAGMKPGTPDGLVMACAYLQTTTEYFDVAMAEPVGVA